MDRRLQLYLNDRLFFDDMFKDMDREVARSHHDMRSAMHRLSPSDKLASGDSDDRISQLRSMYVEKDGKLFLNITLDLSSFHSREIEIRVEGLQLLVKAKYEEKDEQSRVYHEFHREFTLPEGTDVTLLQPSLTKDGILHITGPLPLEATEGNLTIDTNDN